ncbi:isochorismate synthase [Alkalibacillus almallahensis]|uniref:isochorismate synthase n=1 Tax=Alkalibacillus almallahensis TaxID=1379154 RepID=UPI001420DAC7|nr:isochorismate synthase [Alkalibacillus almallahensis]NIK12142.1 menaquinone-specific isochorismate synthase [Alkalibacillus almallahensis]
MIKTDRVSLEAQLNQIEQIEQTQYISIVQKVSPIDPINLFAYFDHLKGERFYWSNATGDLTFVGLGTFKELYVNSSDDRFTAIEDQLNHLKEDINVLHDFDIEGIGPVFFGGFSFFDTPHQDEWEAFPENNFVLAKQMLTVKQGDYFLTHHLEVSPDDSVEALLNQIEQETQAIYEAEPFVQKTRSLVEVQDQLSFDQWSSMIAHAIEEISATNLEKVVLAREVEAVFDRTIPTKDLISALTNQQQYSYVFVMEQGEDAFIGASPERLVSVTNHVMYSACLAGTMSRGETMDVDDLLAWRLLNDEKNLEEHRYVVDMIREAVQPICTHLDIPNEPQIYPLTNVQHLYTPVQGQLKSGVTLFDTLKQLHPTPALGGEPRQDAMNFIKTHEPIERGWYAAPIGWFDQSLNGEFAVAIRSGLISDNRIKLFAGCGIVADSDAKAEYDETNLKLTPMLNALGGNRDDDHGE